ncbi:hypothetical protein M758_1G230300 [Ceratodon purpureus]|nr:hypothetical protein M758_1G230300 [Ceratodon purpureus]
MELTYQLHFRGGASLWNNALYDAESGKFTAGTGITTSRNLAERILTHGVIEEGRAQYIVLDINGSRLGILNVYAPNYTGQRAQFWNLISRSPLPEVDDWLMAGDFNMTELGSDRSQGFDSKNMGPREQSAWARLTLTLGLSDIFYCDEYRQIGSKHFSWNRERPTPCWARLDRFYTSPQLRSRGGKHGIWPNLRHISDHSAVFVQIPFAPKVRHKHAGLNRSLIYHTEAQDRFADSWREAMSGPGDFSKGQRVETAWEQICRISATISSDGTRRAKAAYRAQYGEVEAAEAALQADWGDLGAWEKLNTAQATLEEFRLSKLEKTKNELAAKWITVGDRCSREFFEFHKDRSKKTAITELMDGGRALRTEEEISAYLQRYYETLYTRDEGDLYASGERRAESRERRFGERRAENEV